MVDILGFFRSDLTSGAIVVGIVLLIITGRLIPWWTHKRELGAEKTRADDWREAYYKSEEARVVLVSQNSALLAGVRIADKFYRDFLPAIDEDTQPASPLRGSDVPT